MIQFLEAVVIAVLIIDVRVISIMVAGARLRPYYSNIKHFLNCEFAFTRCADAI